MEKYGIKAQNIILGLLKSFLGPTIEVDGKKVPLNSLPSSDDDLGRLAYQKLDDLAVNQDLTSLLKRYQKPIRRKKARAMSYIFGEPMDKSVEMVRDMEDTGSIFNKVMDITIGRQYKAALGQFDQAARRMGIPDTSTPQGRWENEKLKAVRRNFMDTITSGENFANMYSLAPEQAAGLAVRYMPGVYNQIRDNRNFIRQKDGSLRLRPELKSSLENNIQNVLYVGDRVNQLIPGEGNTVQKLQGLNKIMGTDIIRKYGTGGAARKLNTLIATSDQFNEDPFSLLSTMAQGYRKQGKDPALALEQAPMVLTARKLTGATGQDLDTFTRDYLTQLNTAKTQNPVNKVLAAGFGAMAAEGDKQQAYRKIQNIYTEHLKDLKRHPWMARMTKEKQLDYLLGDINEELRDSISKDDLGVHIQTPDAQKFLQKMPAYSSLGQRAGDLEKELFKQLTSKGILDRNVEDYIQRHGRTNMETIREAMDRKFAGTATERNRKMNQVRQMYDQLAKQQGFTSGKSMNYLMNVQADPRFRQTSQRVGKRSDAMRQYAHAGKSPGIVPRQLKWIKNLTDVGLKDNVMDYMNIPRTEDT